MKKFRFMSIMVAFILGISFVLVSKQYAFASSQVGYPSGLGYYSIGYDCVFSDICPGGNAACKGFGYYGLVTLREGTFSNGHCGIILGQP